MFTAGDCKVKCIESKHFIYEIATEDTVYDITEISNYENQQYCIQLGCLNSSTSANSIDITYDKLKDSIISYYYDLQLINNEYIGFNIDTDYIRTISSNEDVFIKQHYDEHHMNYHINTIYATDSDSSNPENDFVVKNPDEISKVSIGNYYIDSEHFEFYSRYLFSGNYENFHFKMVIQLGIYFVIFDFENNVRLRMRFATMTKDYKFDYFYSLILYEFNPKSDTYFAINFENKFNEFTRVTLSLNDNTTYYYEVEEYMIPFTKCTIVSNMYVEFRGYRLITVRSNIDENSTYLYSENSSNKLLKYDITEILKTYKDMPNVIFNIGCKYTYENKMDDRSFDLTFDQPNLRINATNLLTNDQLFLIDERTVHLTTVAQSTLFKHLTLINQNQFIKDEVSDDTSNNYHSLKFNNDRNYYAFYRYQWNDIHSCYGYKQRFTLDSLELFRNIEAYSAKYSIYGLNFIISTNFNTTSPNTYRILPDTTGGEFQSTNIIPLDQIDEIEYITPKSYRYIEIHGVLNDLRTKFNITDDTITKIYLEGISIVFTEQNQYFELSSNSNHTLKVINLDEPLPVIISIEY